MRINNKYAILVFGGSIYRQLAALNLFFEIGGAPIYLIGDKSFYFENFDSSIKRINNLKEWSGDKIFYLLSESNNTIEDVLALKKIIEATKFNKFFIITSNFHKRRVSWLINKVLHENQQKRICIKECTDPVSRITEIIEFIKFFFYKLKFKNVKFYNTSAECGQNYK